METPEAVVQLAGERCEPRTRTDMVGRSRGSDGQETRPRGSRASALHSGGFTRAQCARFLDAHPEQGRRVVLALRVPGVAVEETVFGIRGIGRVCGIHARSTFDGRGRASPSEETDAAC